MSDLRERVLDWLAQEVREANLSHMRVKKLYPTWEADVLLGLHNLAVAALRAVIEAHECQEVVRLNQSSAPVAYECGGDCPVAIAARELGLI